MSAAREGFTTGSAATAAACAAVELLLTGKSPERVLVPLPPFAAEEPAGRLEIAIADAFFPHGDNSTAAASVVKDGGDDPDATHRAVIEVRARFDASLPPAELRIEGGRGIGRVTLPGLPLSVGEAAINPVPREQIRRAVRSLPAYLHMRTSPCGLVLTVCAPEGERIALRTLNPRLGIIGGISILGTHGTVRPYSHEAWQSAVLLSLDVARAARDTARNDAETPAGLPALCLSTGRRSERLLMARYPALPPSFFIQAADYAAFSLRAAAERGFTPLAWGCFFGKLVKLAQGLEYTHARCAPLDMNFIARTFADENSANPALEKELTACVTASRALDMLLPAPGGSAAVARIAALAAGNARRFADGPVAVHLFHSDGRELLVA